MRISLVDGHSVLTRVAAGSPLKLLCPRRGGRAAWVYTSSFGGGLVAGDTVDLSLELDAGTTGVVTTQASTKVYRSTRNRTCRQRLSALIGPAATLAVVPDPLTCYAGAVYDQVNRYRLAEDAALVSVDWLTSGRRARGESWQFARVTLRTEITRGDQPWIVDSLELDPRDGPLDGPCRLAGYHCLAVVILAGRRLADPARRLLEQVTDRDIDLDGPVLEAASPVDDGLIWRVLATSTEHAARHLAGRLDFLADLLGETPWNRKW